MTGHFLGEVIMKFRPSSMTTFAFGFWRRPLFSCERRAAALTTLFSRSTIVRDFTSGKTEVAPAATPPPKHIIRTSSGLGWSIGARSPIILKQSRCG